MVVIASEVENPEDGPDSGQDKYSESYTWTFYRLQTTRGLVVMRWYGESNGYYSESVEFAEVEQK